MNSYEKALQNIKRDRKCKPTCCFGPTGPAGPAGPTTISIGNTTTGDPGTEAIVTNVGTSENLVLEFTIPEGSTGPTGPTGSTGPTGPAATINSILVDNDGEQSVNSNSLIDLGTIINSTGTTITFTAPNTVTLTPGSYYILYESLISNTTDPGDIGATLQVNGVDVPNASEYIATNDIENQIALQHNLTVTENTTIAVINRSTVANTYHDSSLSVLQLG